MVAVGVIGLPAYFLLFKERVRSRGQLKPAAILVAVSILVGAAAAFALSRLHGH
jgi:hypothetical protein